MTTSLKPSAGRIGVHALDQAIDAGAIVLAANKQVGQPMGINATQIGAHQALGEDGRVRPKAAAASGSTRTTSCKVAMLLSLGAP